MTANGEKTVGISNGHLAPLKASGQAQTSLSMHVRNKFPRAFDGVAGGREVMRAEARTRSVFENQLALQMANSS